MSGQQLKCLEHGMITEKRPDSLSEEENSINILVIMQDFFFRNRPFEESNGMMLLIFIIISPCPSMENPEFPLENKYFSLHMIFYSTTLSK